MKNLPTTTKRLWMVIGNDDYVGNVGDVLSYSKSKKLAEVSHKEQKSFFSYVRQETEEDVQQRLAKIEKQNSNSS